MARPRGGPHIENVDYWDRSEEELQYIIKDAGEAAKALRGHDLRAEGKYLDQVNDASTVLYARRQQAAGMQEQGLPRGYDAWRTSSPHDDEADPDLSNQVAKDCGIRYLESDSAKAYISDYLDYPEESDDFRADLISDVEGTIKNCFDSYNYDTHRSDQVYLDDADLFVLAEELVDNVLKNAMLARKQKMVPPTPNY